MSSEVSLMDIDQLEPTIQELGEHEWNVNNEDDLVRYLFKQTKPTPNWKEQYQLEQRKIKRQDREKCNYESESTSEDAQIENLGDVKVDLKEIRKVCQWSPNNKLWHIIYGKKGVMDLTATFKGIKFDPLVEEYQVRNTLIRANIQHRQYPVECVCLEHKGSSEEDIHQVLQAKPGTSPDKFWYTYDGLRKSVLFEAPFPDEEENIKVHMKLCCLCCDSCDAASRKYLNLIDNAGKEAGRDWLLVSTLEARKDEKQVILARNVLPCWFKAAVIPRDLKKLERRKEKGGGAQKKSRLKRLQENSLLPPPQGSKRLSADIPDHDYITISPTVVTMDWKFHADVLKEYLKNNGVTRNELEQRLFNDDP
eukprot:GFUD01006002.1.p1 GENE.GFUD01006002.1~~GFUD01006002.1.p1  ORF type:complete len:365 (+),score=99.92 GFUD01006002.1:277-1371(+)